MFHQKTDGVAAAAAAKTFVYFLGRRNGERRRFLIVKRAEPQVIGAPFLQLYKRAYYIDDIDTAEYLLYGVLRDQKMQVKNLQFNNPEGTFQRRAASKFCFEV